MNPSTVRLDKWLWAVRLYKTRSLATEACRLGRVTIAGQTVKPARSVHPGEVVVAKTGDLTRTYQVLALVEQRVGAPAVKEFATDLTPAEEYARRREAVLEPVFAWPKGQGRPTKRDRRRLDEML